MQWMNNESHKRPVYEVVIKQLKKYDDPMLLALAATDLRDVDLFLPHCWEIHVWEKDKARRLQMQATRTLSYTRSEQRKISIVKGDVKEAIMMLVAVYDVMFLDTNWADFTLYSFIERVLRHNQKDKFSLVSEVLNNNRYPTSEIQVLDRIQSIALRNGWRVPLARGICTYPCSSELRGNNWMVCNEFVFAKE